MALGRYTQLAYSDPNDMPLVSLPYEALDQVLGQYQQTKDYYDSLEGLSFNYLTESPTDVSLAGQVRQYQKDLGQQVGERAAEGDITKYQAALRSGIRSLVDLRTPGGPVYALENRVTQMQAAKEELKKRYDKLTDVNFDYALSQLKPGDVGYNLSTGDYNKITAPTVQDFIDINELTRKTAQAMVAEKGAISKIMGDYVWLESGEKYYIGDALENMMNSPEVAEQMKINTWYRTNQLTDQQKVATIQAKEAAAQQDLQSLSTASDELAGLVKSKSKSDITDLQNTLKSLGFDPGPIDGKWGDRTEAAYNQAQNYISESAKKMKLDYEEKDLPSIIYDELRNSYLGYGKALRPDSFSRKIQMASLAGKFRYQRAAQQHLLEQFAVATQADLFPVPLPGSDFDAGKIEKEARDALKQSEVTAMTELAKLRGDNIFAESETLDGVVSKWQSLASMKEEFPEDYKQKFAETYTGGDMQKANAMIQTLEFDNVGLIPALRERARLKKTTDMISMENEQVRQTFTGRKGEEIIQKAWKQVNQLATTPLYKEPGDPDIATVLKGYNYQKFKDEFVASPSGVPIVGWKHGGSAMREAFNKEMNKDIEANQDLYKSQINYGIRGDSEIFKKIEGIVLPIEKANHFRNMNKDPYGTPATYMRDGKEVDVDMEGNADLMFSVVAGEPVMIFSRQGKDGKGTARMTVMPSDIGQSEFFRERGLELAAEAINNRNMNDAITLLPFLQTEDPLETWAKHIISPESQGKIGNFVIRDKQGKITEPVFEGANYSVLSTDDKTGVSAITVTTPNGNKKYFNGIIDDNGDVTLEPDDNGVVGLPVTMTHAENRVKLYKLLADPKFLQIRQKFKEKPLSTIAPERRGEIMEIMQQSGSFNLYEDNE